MIDLGPEGAGIEHSERVASNDLYVLDVRWRQSFKSRVFIRHSQLLRLADDSGSALFRTGLVFDKLSEDAAIVIESILIDEVKSKVAEWEANMTGTRRDRLPGFTEARLAPAVGYTWYRLVNGRWLTVATHDPNQPIDGFAVRDDEDKRQIELLCNAYEHYDEDDRQMLRMMAHLAIANRPSA